MTIPAHLEEMRRIGMIPVHSSLKHEGPDEFGMEASMIAVPIGDSVANLMRPCYHSLGLGKYKLFYLEDEPISTKDYWCVCFFRTKRGKAKLVLDRIRFDAEQDRALSLSKEDLVEQGLVWAASLVPLIANGRALSAVEIAQNNYDLRQIVGRGADEAIRYAYEGWFDQWDARVEKVVSDHIKSGAGFARYYHSILGLDESSNVYLYQIEGTLPDLANTLAREGIVAAGVLDSGGSCALYDVWMGSYLNHNWYFREPRGGILVFELSSYQRIPRSTPDSWFNRRRKVGI
jgi:hypothetical protein